MIPTACSVLFGVGLVFFPHKDINSTAEIKSSENASSFTLFIFLIRTQPRLFLLDSFLLHIGKSAT